MLNDILTRWKLRRCAAIGAGARALGRIWIHGDGEIRIGARAVLDGRGVPIELHAQGKRSRVVIGDDVIIEGGTSIEAVEQVTLGDHCRLGPFVKVLDNQFHPLRGDRHRTPRSEPVDVGDDVHIEARAILLPGTTLERGVRVCAGAVVSRRVPAGLTVSGLPATRRSDARPGP